MMEAEQQKTKAIKVYKLTYHLMMFALAFFIGLMLYGEITGSNFLHSHPYELLFIGLIIIRYCYFLKKLLVYLENEDRA